jgi:hypothetical protein
MAYLHGQWFWQCWMRQPHLTPHKNRIIPIFGCGCHIWLCQNHCSCKQTFKAWIIFFKYFFRISPLF